MIDLTEKSSSGIVPGIDFGPDRQWDEHQRFNGVGRSHSKPIHFTAFADIRITNEARYFVNGLIPTPGLVVVWGPPKCGKSFFVFDMVAHVAAGWEYRGRRVKQCPVVYFALEGQQGFSARIEAFKRAHGANDISFYLSGDRIMLPQDSDAIVQSIRQQCPNPGIVVLDTLNRSITGSENDPKDMGGYVRAADAIREAFNCTVIIVHHCGIQGDRPRGHTALTGAADAQLAVKRDNSGNIVTTVEFMKDGPQDDQIISRLEPVTIGHTSDGDEITTCVVHTSNDGAASSRKFTGKTELAYRILCNLIAESGKPPPVSLLDRTKSRTICMSEWRQNFYAGTASDGISQTSQQKAFVRAVDKLIELQAIGKCDDHVWLP